MMSEAQLKLRFRTFYLDVVDDVRWELAQPILVEFSGTRNLGLSKIESSQIRGLPFGLVLTILVDIKFAAQPVTRN